MILNILIVSLLARYLISIRPLGLFLLHIRWIDILLVNILLVEAQFYLRHLLLFLFVSLRLILQLIWCWTVRGSVILGGLTVCIWRCNNALLRIRITRIIFILLESFIKFEHFLSFFLLLFFHLLKQVLFKLVDSNLLILPLFVWITACSDILNLLQNIIIWQFFLLFKLIIKLLKFFLLLANVLLVLQ